MIQTIGALERAIGRLEQAAAALPARAQTPPGPPVDASSARAALKSLDDLITEIKARTDG